MGYLCGIGNERLKKGSNVLEILLHFGHTNVDLY